MEAHVFCDLLMTLNDLEDHFNYRKKFLGTTQVYFE